MSKFEKHHTSLGCSGANACFVRGRWALCCRGQDYSTVAALYCGRKTCMLRRTTLQQLAAWQPLGSAISCDGSSLCSYQPLLSA